MCVSAKSASLFPLLGMTNQRSAQFYQHRPTHYPVSRLVTMDTREAQTDIAW
jgi:hypothetical protein